MHDTHNVKFLTDTYNFQIILFSMSQSKRYELLYKLIKSDLFVVSQVHFLFYVAANTKWYSF